MTDEIINNIRSGPSPYNHQPYWYDSVYTYTRYINDFTLSGQGATCLILSRPKYETVNSFTNQHDMLPSLYQYDNDRYAVGIRLGRCNNKLTGLLAIRFTAVDKNAMSSLVAELPDKKVPLFAEPLSDIINGRKITLSYSKINPDKYYKRESQSSTYTLGEHKLSELFFRSKQLVEDPWNYPPGWFSVLLAYRTSEFPDWLTSRSLVVPGPDNSNGVMLMAEKYHITFDPHAGHRFYTQLPQNCLSLDEDLDFSYTFLDRLGIITLDRESLEGVFSAIRRWGLEVARKRVWSRSENFGGCR